MKAVGIGAESVSSVLFLCGMNAIRSPMAEAIARDLLPKTVYVQSAGVRAGERDPFVDAVLAEHDLSLGKRRPQLFEDLEDGYFDLIVTMAPEAHHMALDAMGTASVEVEFWPMPDPSVASGTREQIMSAYRDLFGRLERRLKTRFAKG